MTVGPEQVPRFRGFKRLGYWFILLVFTSFFVLPVSFGVSQVMDGESLITPTGEDVTLADILVEIRHLNQELEAVRQYMGAPKVEPLNIRVNHAAPHDIYFQAITLITKVNRLSFEVTRRRHHHPEESAKIYKLEDVLLLIKESHRILDGIMTGFGIVAEHSFVERLTATSPSDVFQEILITNQQLNFLMQRGFEPSDVYTQVTQAIGYATILLTPYPDAIPTPDPLAYIPNKSPGDVYFLLLTCLEEIQKIYASSNLSTLAIHAKQIDKDKITSSDVFDLASLLVARLNYLIQHFKNNEKPPKAFYPGRKYPSDVYQRASILLNQLQQLVQFVPANGPSH